MNLFAAGVILEKDGKFLMVQEANPDAFGLWNWPAGHADKGETIEETAIREAKEETGFDVELDQVVGLWSKEQEIDDPNWRKKLFTGRIVGGELKHQESELLDAKWFTEDEIRAMADKLRSIWVIEGLDKLNNISTAQGEPLKMG